MDMVGSNSENRHSTPSSLYFFGVTGQFAVMVQSLWLLLHLVGGANVMELPSSCLGLPNGYHWIKPLSDGVDVVYPPINALCSNEYLILDVNHDPNMRSYFQSFDSYHYALSGADHQTSVNWREWFIPSLKDDESHLPPSFVLSPDCSICDETDSDVQEFGSNTAYYMTGTIFGCLSTYKAERDCSWDWETYECSYCTMVQSDSDLGMLSTESVVFAV